MIFHSPSSTHFSSFTLSRSACLILHIENRIRQEPCGLLATLHLAHILCLPYSYSEWRVCASTRANPSTCTLHLSFLSHQFLPLSWIEIPTCLKSHAPYISLILHLPPATTPIFLFPFASKLCEFSAVAVSTSTPIRPQIKLGWVSASTCLPRNPMFQKPMFSPGHHLTADFLVFPAVGHTPPWCASPGVQVSSEFPLIALLLWAQLLDPSSVSSCSFGH